jgi:hypothetical protein
MTKVSYSDIKRLLITGSLEFNISDDIYFIKDNVYNNLINNLNKINNYSYPNIDNTKSSDKASYTNKIIQMDRFIRNHFFDGCLIDFSENNYHNLDNRHIFNGIIGLRPRFINKFYTINENSDNFIKKFYKNTMNIICRRRMLTSKQGDTKVLDLAIKIKSNVDTHLACIISIKDRYKDCGAVIVNNITFLRAGTEIDSVVVHMKETKPLYNLIDMIDIEFVIL